MSRRAVRSKQNPYANVPDSEPSRRGPAGLRRRWLIGVGLLLVGLLAAAAVDLTRINAGIRRIPLQPTGSASPDETFLIVGTDTRAFVRDEGTASHWGSAAEVPGERADMLAYVRLPQTGAPQVMMLSRDLVVPVEGNGDQRIGLTLTRGPQLLVDTLCTSVGLPVDHIVIVDFLAFRKLVAAAGYIEVESDVAIRDQVSGLDFERPGVFRLDQDQALSYVRSRQAVILDKQGNWVPESDASQHRVERQGRALEALVARHRAFSGPLGLRRVARAAAGSTRIDRGFGLSEAIAMRKALSAMNDRATRRNLRVQYIDGAIPRAYFTTGSATDLRAVGAGTTLTCPLPPSIDAVDMTHGANTQL